MLMWQEITELHKYETLLTSIQCFIFMILCYYYVHKVCHHNQFVFCLFASSLGTWFFADGITKFIRFIQLIQQYNTQLPSELPSELSPVTLSLIAARLSTAITGSVILGIIIKKKLWRYFD